MTSFRSRLATIIFHLFHTPGHTTGQLAVHVPEEGLLFTGDTIFANCQTWFQVDESDPSAWLNSLRFLRTLDFEQIVPDMDLLWERAI